MDNFEGKIAFVTGATSGIGRARAIASRVLAPRLQFLAGARRRPKDARPPARGGGEGIFIPVDLAREANCAGVDLNARLINYTEVDFSCPKPRGAKEPVIG